MLAQVLRPVRRIFDPSDFPDLLVGLEGPDDAAVWRLDESRALVVTTDFFTPVVDDPYDYGAIAAANSLSDVYAMGGRPFLCLNIAAFPAGLPEEVASEILRGGAEKAQEAGAVIAGGHTIQDEEPKYGLIALGFVEPSRMMTKSGARSGDRLVLTKPLGFGVTTTALKRQEAEPEHVAEAVRWMSALNRSAGELAVEAEVAGATDVTGFGLLGHGWEMARASGVGLRLHFDRIPFLGGAKKYAGNWTFPGGTLDNRSYFGSRVKFPSGLSEEFQLLLFDAQTSGGLLLAVQPDRLERLLQKAEAREVSLWVIGEVLEGEGIEVD
jgi:selenide,water dikinase